MPRLLTAVLAALVLSAGAAQAGEYSITIKDHKFVPPELEVPADTEFTLKVINADPTPEEFESHGLDVEKVVAGNQSIVVHLGPLDAGRYGFFGEYHEDTAQGALIAK
jgi:hypothetical protein